MKQAYKIASNREEYDQVHALMRKEGVLRTRLDFPTIMAMEGDNLVGSIGTRIDKKMIVAGPLVLRSDRQRIFTALRLAEAYEMAMRNLNIKSFIFYGEADGLLVRAIQRYYPHVTPYSVVGSNNFYIWKINDGWRGSKHTGAVS